MKKIITGIVILTNIFLFNCASGEIAKSKIGGKQVVHVRMIGTNVFGLSPAGIEACSKWLRKEGVKEVYSVNNAMNNVLVHSMFNKIYSTPASTTRVESCEGIGSK